MNAGFSTAEKTWLPINSNYIDINVDSELLDPSSHLNIYKSLIVARFVIQSALVVLDF